LPEIYLVTNLQNTLDRLAFILYHITIENILAG
jgi:hypothetical protein